MRQFVRHNACDFLAGQRAEQARGRGDGGVFVIAPGRKGIRLRCFNNVDARCRQASAFCHAGHITRKCAQHGGGGLRRDLFGTLHAQDNLVGIPPRKYVHASGSDKGDCHAENTADQIADRHEQRG